MCYIVGQKITTRYTNAPLSPEQWYQIGQIVDVSDAETQTVLAQFCVLATDDTTITGIIVAEGAHVGAPVWIVGKVDSQNYLEWEFQGIYDDEQRAVEVCEDSTWFVGPARINECVPSHRIDWPGAYYPKVVAAL